MKITIYSKIPSNNFLLRLHWFNRKKLKAKFVVEIWAMLHGVVPFPIKREKKKKKMIVTLYRKGRRFDQANAIAGVDKMIVDPLVELGLIRNDSPRWLDLDVRQELDHIHPRTEIEII